MQHLNKKYGILRNLKHRKYNFMLHCAYSYIHFINQHMYLIKYNKLQIKRHNSR
jgi:hypothetical protein